MYYVDNRSTRCHRGYINARERRESSTLRWKIWKDRCVRRHTGQQSASVTVAVNEQGDPSVVVLDLVENKTR